MRYYISLIINFFIPIQILSKEKSIFSRSGIGWNTHNVRFESNLSNTERGLNPGNKFNRICLKDVKERGELEDGCNKLDETNQYMKQNGTITFELHPTELNRFLTLDFIIGFNNDILFFRDYPLKGIESEVSYQSIYLGNPLSIKFGDKKFGEKGLFFRIGAGPLIVNYFNFNIKNNYYEKNHPGLETNGYTIHIEFIYKNFFIRGNNALNIKKLIPESSIQKEHELIHDINDSVFGYYYYF